MFIVRAEEDTEHRPRRAGKAEIRERRIGAGPAPSSESPARAGEYRMEGSENRKDLIIKKA